MSIAGSDCSGGAGIQADLKTISALGAYAATAITAITVQNTTGVRAIHPVPPVFVRGQIEAVMDDTPASSEAAAAPARKTSAKSLHSGNP